MAENKAVAATPAKSTPKSQADNVIAGIRDIVSTALPSTVTLDKFRDTFLTAGFKEPKIFQSEIGSVQQALIQSARSGLLPDGKMAALVPFRNNKSAYQNKQEIVFIIMVMGYIHLFKKHAGVHSMAVNVIFSKDKFTYIEGDETILKHEPDVFAEDRGDMLGVYAIFKDAEGRVMHREVMNRSQVMKAKAVSKIGDSGPWSGFEEEMWRKTVIRRSAKYLPLTEEGQRILDAEDTATVDFDLPKSNHRQVDGYNPLVTAARIPQENDAGADDDGVVDHMENQQDDQPQGGQQQEEEQRSDDTPFDPDRDQPKEEAKVETRSTRQQTDVVTDMQRDGAWDAGLDAKANGSPMVPPEEYQGELEAIWKRAWMKGVVEEKKPSAEKASDAKPKVEAKPKSGQVKPDPEIVKDAQLKALNGADRQVPGGTAPEQQQHWLDAYDAQVKDAESNG